ncbi:squalene synthase HpnC [Pollutimonas harenae]|uniref:Squalene synthase HpnC n=1 Tax=Pollutimonas harenae TaxID=657015 RepID=A0A853GTW6_9BURK|nr:squalene synthase HpnC [Pollutimonas harenae]NYT86608.1 squalene synthase HpnC [Pollutimonas harenae]TEA69653.1 squalene synthase HpnC [Pollutimonas harenae]
MAVDHYENFPVASLLLPRRLRIPVQNIYRYARNADDIADEGTATSAQRLEQLGLYRDALQRIADGKLNLEPTDPRLAVFEPLAQTIGQHTLPMAPFFDLLSAFEQDVDTTRYACDADLFDYCRRSANPVGTLMLHLYDKATADNLAFSDAICTGLQLTNFWQDIAIDWQKNRIYLPQDKLKRHGVAEDFIAGQTRLSLLGGKQTESSFRPSPEGWQTLMSEQVAQARELLISGLPLTHRLGGRIGFELKLVVHGGLRILERLEQLHYDMFFQRPTLTKSDWALLLWRALG